MPVVSTRRRILTIGLAVAASFSVLAGVADAAPSATNPSNDAPSGHPDPLIALSQIREMANAAPDLTAGVSARNPSEITLHLVEGAPQDDAVLATIRRIASTAGIKLAVETERRSLADLNRVRAAIRADRALSSAGLLAVIDPASNQVHVTAPTVSPKLSTAFRTQYGDAVRVTKRSPGGRGSGRFNDSAPFYGGIRIANPANFCTFGFTLINKSGIRYGVTAGHCFDQGAGVSATRWFPGSNSSGTGYADFGRVEFRRFGDGQLDNELIGGGSFGSHTWIDPDLRADPAQELPVRSVVDSNPDNLVFSNGSVAGRRLMQVESYLGCSKILGDNITSCGMWLASPADGTSQGCGPGNSGGPVFAYDGAGGITAVGIITGWVDGYCVYTSMSEILHYWQSTIATG